MKKVSNFSNLFCIFPIHFSKAERATEKRSFQVLQNIPRGQHGHPAAKHVVMETERGIDLAVHIVTMLNQVIY